jgi:hypothetical protein
MRKTCCIHGAQHGHGHGANEFVPTPAQRHADFVAARRSLLQQPRVSDSSPRLLQSKGDSSKISEDKPTEPPKLPTKGSYDDVVLQRLCGPPGTLSSQAVTDWTHVGATPSSHYYFDGTYYGPTLQGYENLSPRTGYGAVRSKVCK